jgi:DNA-binding transcriptional MerR regulator
MTRYSIDQFSEITGITKFVLRTWENRYGYLKAERSDSNFRIYTDKMVIRALNTNYLLNNGFKISKIASLSDEEIFQEVGYIKINNNSTNSEYFINEIIVAALTFNSIKFDKVYTEGVQEFGLLEFYKKVILQAMHKIGILWLTNRVAPSQEHFLSELIKQKIAVATDSKFSKDNIGPSWLLFLPEGEFHEIGLLFAKFLLVQEGYNVIFLGPNVPYGSLFQVSQNIKIENTLLFCVANATKNNLDFTIKYLESNFTNTNHYIISNELSVDASLIESDVKVFTELDHFIKEISK